MRAALILAALVASGSAFAAAPAGYAPATIVGTAPEGRQTIEGFAKKRDCGREIDILVERDGRLLPASGKIVCGR